MKKDYLYKDNIIKFGEKEIIFSENIRDVIEFEDCVVIRNKYSNKNPTNNLVAFDFYGKRIWEIDNIIKPLMPQTIVSIRKRDDKHISVITFIGLNLLMEAKTGKVVNKEITK